MEKLLISTIFLKLKRSLNVWVFLPSHKPVIYWPQKGGLCSTMVKRQVKQDKCNLDKTMGSKSNNINLKSQKLHETRYKE